MADIISVGNKQDKWTLRVTELLNWLNDNKSSVLVAGTNITLTQNQDGTITISASGGGGGASALSDLSDTNIVSPTDGEVLKYDGATSKWVNATSGGGSNYVCDLLFENTNVTYVSGNANVNETYILDKSIDDYDAVIVNAYLYVSENGIAEQTQNMFIPRQDFYTRATVGTDLVSWAFVMSASVANDNRRLCFGFDDNVTIKTVATRTSNSVTPTLHKVYGIKFGGQHYYSTDEHIIGIWTDGSTLYEKTIRLSNVMIGYDNDVHTQIAHNVITMGECVDLDICCPKLGVVAKDVLYSGISPLVAFRVNDTYIYATDGTNHFGADVDRVWYFTIKYTKTTN